MFPVVCIRTIHEPSHKTNTVLCRHSRWLDLMKDEVWKSIKMSAEDGPSLNIRGVK